MKLQLNENTLNAYINEAIRQELDEGVWNNVAKFAAKKAASGAAKSAGKLAARKATAKASREAAKKGSKTLVGAARKTGVAARDVNRYNKALIKAGKVDPKEVKQLKNLQKLQRQGKLSQEQTKELRNLERRLSGKGYFTSRANAEALLRARRQQAAIVGGAAALGGAYALGRGTGNNDYQDKPFDGGQTDDNQSGGWDGGFPWDNTQPIMTPPRPTRNNQSNDNQEDNQQEEPIKRDVGPALPKLEPGNLQAGATTNQNNTLNVPQSQPTLAQSAVHSMVQTANAPASDMSLRDKRQTVNRTADNARDAINQGYGNQQDKQMVRDVRRQINRG